MSPGDLAQVLRHLPLPTDPNLIVGTNTVDDAAVYRLSEETALVQTVDFFTPVVDDPYAFGAIAMANALSDIYAMGAQPLIALNIAGFPVGDLPLSTLTAILQGGLDKAAEAGVVIGGGHTITDPEPKYGAAVTGIVHPERIITNAVAKPGDKLILTKPLGTGILTTALKRSLLDNESLATITGIMSSLNKDASEAMVAVGVSAATDITGFGLLGHLSELATASGMGARIIAAAVPTIDNVWSFVEDGIVPGGTRNNLSYLAGRVEWDRSLDESMQLVLTDAQTSGGLLICVPAGKTQLFAAEMASRHSSYWEIGEIIEDGEQRIFVEK